MAAEESSQGAALGPDLSESAGGDALASPGIPDLNEVLGEFMVALCVVEMVYRTLWAQMEESSEEIGSCALALRHGFEMLDAVYNRFDEGLRNYDGPGTDYAGDRGAEPGDDPDEDDASSVDERVNDSERGLKRGKQNRLALVA